MQIRKLANVLLIWGAIIAFPFFSMAQEKGVPEAEQRLPKGVAKPEPGRIEPGGPVKETRIDPPNWWVGMNNPQVELMIHDKNIQQYEAKIDYPGVHLIQNQSAESPNYQFLLLEIDPETKPGTFTIELSKNGQLRKYNYELKPRESGQNRVKGLSTQDFIYLVMPDRFANGDPSNDVFKDMQQKEIDRGKMFFRHGGDLKGIMDHLDYLKELGVTALWLNPVLENDQPYESYHGYAFTDHYRVDKRFGSNADYRQLVDKCHESGIKVIMDIVHNHVGDHHYFIQDLPSTDWISQFDTYTRTNFRDQVVMDPYASEADKAIMQNGWFDVQMPDLNQKNPHVARYLIQNNIWWVEYTGLDAYRIDTYTYPDQAFMSDWGKAMQAEYPTLSMFGETWVHGMANQAQYTEGNHLRGGYNSHLPGVTDFQLYYAIVEAMTKQQGWTEGIARMYQNLSNDFLYQDPLRNVIFLDNHDLSRFYSVVGEDIHKLKSGIAWLFTMRGIPQLYYGTEILLKGFTDPDGKVRQDFPGGWPGDSQNKFTAAGRTAAENDLFDYVKKLSAYHHHTKAQHNGRMVQFVPENGVYTYFRYNDRTTVMVIMNTTDQPVSVDTQRFKERMDGFSKAKNVVTDEMFDILDQIHIDKNETLVLELIK